MRETLRRILMLVAVVGLMSAGGCGAKMWVMVHPPFYSSDVRTVAVARFDSPPESQAGRMVADRLAAALRENGTYRIVLPATLQTARPDENSMNELLESLRQREDVQAVIVGSVEAFAAASRDFYRPVRRPYYSGYGYHRYGYGYGYPYYYEYEHYVENQATVAVWASMVRVSDGETLWSTPSLLAANLRDTGYPPGPRAMMLLDEAVGRVVDQLVEQFAIVRRQIKIDPGEAMRTAAGGEGDQWRYTKDFTSDDAAMYVVLRLPVVADRNPFRATITRQRREHDVLAEREFTWDRSQRVMSLEFSPAELATAGGLGDYEVHFYSQGERVIHHEFHIRPPKQSD